MTRFFNVAGPCDARRHYMLPPERRIPQVRRFIEQEQYFVVHAPRQTGKTTCFRALARELTQSGPFAALHTSCEAGQAAGADVDRGGQAVTDSILESARLYLPDSEAPAPPDLSIGAETRLKAFLTRWSEKCSRPVVLFLDEIDALLDETLVSVLRHLRLGYPERPRHAPQSVALIGLRDVLWLVEGAAIPASSILSAGKRCLSGAEGNTSPAGFGFAQPAADGRWPRRWTRPQSHRRPWTQGGGSRFLEADGYCKDRDPYTAFPETVEPLPFHTMPGYPYPAELRPPASALAERYNTRKIGP